MQQRPLTLLTYLFALTTAWGQGSVYFSNLDSLRGINAPFYDADGTTRLAGENYRAALYFGLPGSQPETFMRAGAAQPFRTGTFAGYWVPANIVLPAPAPGGTFLVQVRFWDTQGGTLATFEQARAMGAKVGFSSVLPISVPLSGTTSLTGLRSASLIPVVPELARGETRTILDSMAVPNGLALDALCSQPVGLSRWFQAGFATPGEAVIHTDGSAVDTVLSVFTNCLLSPNGCVLVACNDNRAPGQTASEVRFQAQTNVTYVVVVAGANGTTGTAHVTFSLPVTLNAQSLPENQVQVSWPVDASDFSLEYSTNTTSGWRPVPITPIVVGDHNTVAIDASGPCKLYRLKRN